MTVDQSSTSEMTRAEAQPGRPGGLPPGDLAEFADAPVIFFDGLCGLCDRWVGFVLKHDRRGSFRFAALQGETARHWLQIDPDQPLNSVVLLDGQGAHLKADAISRVLVRLGSIWTIPGWLLRLVPRFLRNRGYDVVARHRYRWFGKKESCRLPTPSERARFLP